MTTLTLAIVIVFCIGYFFIAIESVTKINKAAIALLMLVATWTLFMLDPANYLPLGTEADRRVTLWWQPTQGHALSPRHASNDGEAWQQFYRTQRTIRAQSG